MTTTVAQLKTEVIADDSKFRATLQTDEALLKQFGANSGAALAPIGASFTQIGSASQAAAASSQSAIRAIGASAVSISAPIQGIGSAFQATGQNVTEAASVASASLQNLGNVGAATGVSIAQLASQKANLLAQLKNVETSIRTETKALADAQSQVALSGTGHKALNTAVTESEAALTGYIQQQINLKGQLGGVNSALSATTGATNTVTPAVKKVTESTTEAAKATGFWSNLLNTQTSQISTSGGVLKGWDALIQAGARSMGGISVAAAASISILAVLAEKFLHSSKETEKLNAVSKELIQTDAALAEIFGRMSNASSTVVKSLSEQGAKFREFLQIDLSSQLTNVGKAIASVEQAEQSSKAAADAYKEDQRIIAENSKILSGAIQKQGADFGFLQNQLEAAQTRSASYRDTEAELNAKRQKSQTELNKHIDSLANFSKASNVATSEIFAQARAANWNTEAMDRLRVSLDATTSAWAKYDEKVKAFQLPNLDISGSVSALTKGRQELNENIEKGLAAHRSEAEVVSALKPQYESYTKSILNSAAAKAAEQGKSLDWKAGQESVRKELQAGGDALSKLSDKFLLYDKNLSDVSKKTEPHTKAVKDAYSSMTKDTTQVLQGWVSAHGESFSNLRHIFNTLSGEERATLLGRAKAYDDNVNAIQQTQLLQLADRRNFLQKMSALNEGFAPNVGMFDKVSLDRSFADFDKVVQEMKIRIAGGLDLSDQTLKLKSQSDTIINTYEELARQGGKNVNDLKFAVSNAFANLNKTSTSQAKATTDEAQRIWLEGIGRIRSSIELAGKTSPKITLIDKASFQQSFLEMENVIEKAKHSIAGLDDPEIIVSSANATQRIIQNWTQFGAVMHLSTDEIVTGVNGSLAALLKTAPELVGKAATATANRWSDELLRHKTDFGLGVQALSDSLKGLDVSILDQTKLQESVKQYTDSLKQMREASVDELPAAQAAVAQSSEALVQVFVGTTEKIGVSQEEIKKRTAQFFESLGILMTGGAKKIGTAVQKELITNLEPTFTAFRRMIEQNTDFSRLKEQNNIASYTSSIIREFETAADRLGFVGTEWQNYVLEHTRRVLGQLPTETKAITDQQLRVWTDGLNRLPGSLDSMVNRLMDSMGKFDLQAREAFKGTIGGIIDIASNIPGAIGEKLNSATNIFITWVNKIDSVLHGLHKIFGSVSDGLAPLIQSLMAKLNLGGAASSSVGSIDLSGIGNTQQQIQATAKAAATGTKSIADSAVKNASKFSGAFGMMGAAMAGFTANMAVTAATGSKLTGGIVGGLTGAFSGFLAGGMKGSALGPHGAIIGAAIGGGISLLGSLFGGGKSKAQKEAEEQAKQKAGLDMQKTAQDISNAALEGLKKGLEVLEGIADFANIPDKQFSQFMKAYEATIKRVLAFAGTLSKESIEAGKLFGESVQPISESLNSMVQFYAALPGVAIPVKEKVNQFVTAMVDTVSILSTKLEEAAIVGTKGVSKWALRVKDIVGMLSDSASAFNAISSSMAVPIAKLTSFVESVKQTVQLIKDAADWHDLYGVKAAAKYAERSKAMMELLTSTATAFDAVNKSGGLNAGNIKSFISGLKDVVIEFVAMAATLPDLSASASATAALKSIVDVFAPAVTGMASLSNHSRVARDQMVLFTDDLMAMAGLMSEAVKTAPMDMLNAAADFSEKMKPVVELFAPAVTGMTALKGTSKLGISEAQGFIANLVTIANLISVATQTVSTEMLAKASDFAVKMKPVVDLIVPALDGFKRLREEGAKAINDLSGFKSNVTLIAQSIIDLNNGFDSESLAGAARFSDISKRIFEFVSTAVSAFQGVSGLNWSVLQSFSTVETAIGLALNKFISLAASFPGDTLTTVADFLSTTLNITSAIASIGAFFKGYEPAGDAISLINSDFDKISAWMDSTEALASKWNTQGENIQSYLQKLAASLKSGFGSLSSIAGGVNVSVGGLALEGAGDSLPSGVPLATRPSGAGAQSRGASQPEIVNIHIHNHGSVLMQRDFESSVETVLVSLKRKRGRE